MKLTRKKLMEIIKQEILEFTTTAGGTTATKRKTAAKTDVTSKKSDRKSKKSTWDTKKATKTTRQSAYDTSQSDYTTKNSDLTAFNSRKYRKAGKAKGSYVYSATPARGYSLNPDWTTKNNAKTSALTDRNTKLAQKNTADKAATSAETDYNTAVDNLTASEKANKAVGKETSFAVSAGGGGRGAGKGGTAKGKGGKKGKKESIFRILGRDLINELKDIKKYS
jgi:hypothetical protein